MILIVKGRVRVKTQAAVCVKHCMYPVIHITCYQGEET